MGQYFRPVIETGKDKVIAIETYLDGEYECCKLMEQAWFTHPFVNAVVSRLHDKPNRIAWVGGYAKNVKDEFPNTPVDMLYETAWGDDTAQFKGLKTVNFELNDKFFVNHDTAEFIDLNKYLKENIDKDKYCTHPIVLLTAIGNGQGGGDFIYHAESKEQIADVGKWAWNTVEITDIAPKGYKEVMYHFREV